MDLDNTEEFVEDSEYEISKRELIAENIRFSVFLDTITQDGEVAIKDYMSISPKSSDENQITGVITLPVDNGKYGLVKIYRPPIQDFSWELPGGFIEPDETPALAAIRELKEETGLICEEEHLIHLGTFFPSPGLLSGKLCIFSAEKCTPGTEKEKNDPGVSQFKWFSEEEIDESISKGSIYDMAMLLAIHRRTKHFKNLLDSTKNLSK